MEPEVINLDSDDDDVAVGFCAAVNAGGDVVLAKAARDTIISELRQMGFSKDTATAAARGAATVDVALQRLMAAKRKEQSARPKKRGWTVSSSSSSSSASSASPVPSAAPSAPPQAAFARGSVQDLTEGRCKICDGVGDLDLYTLHCKCRLHRECVQNCLAASLQESAATVGETAFLRCPVCSALLPWQDVHELVEPGSFDSYVCALARRLGGLGIGAKANVRAPAAPEDEEVSTLSAQMVALVRAKSGLSAPWVDDTQTRGAGSSKSMKKKPSPTKTTSASGRTTWAAGTGFGGSASEKGVSSVSQVKAAERRQVQRDMTLTSAITELSSAVRALALFRASPCADGASNTASASTSEPGSTATAASTRSRRRRSSSASAASKATEAAEVEVISVDPPKHESHPSEVDPYLVASGALLQYWRDAQAVKQRKGGSLPRGAIAEAAEMPSLGRLLSFYLRNDSLTDLARRASLYLAVLRLVRVLAAHPVFSPVLLCCPPEAREAEAAEKAKRDGAAEVSSNVADSTAPEFPSASSVDEGRRRNSRLCHGEPGSPLWSLHRLNQQADGYVKLGQATHSTAASLEDVAFCTTLEIALEVRAAYNETTRLAVFLKGGGTVDADASSSFASEGNARKQRRNLIAAAVAADVAAATGAAGSAGGAGALGSSAAPAGDGVAGVSTEVARMYTEALTGLQFKSVALIDMVTTGAVSHRFVAEAKKCGMGVGGSMRKRMLRISQELSSLSTSLPLEWNSSIFCRMDSDRPDVLSILILGPTGTPYAGGAFIFDVWLPLRYPDVPPKVKLQTTAGGSVRFNPNLYADGKVCLSLLGTWSGPGWDPKQSTLLQVLVSIQSLIMVDEPYFNEPGYERTIGTPHGQAESARYNRNVREATLRYGVLAHMKNPTLLFRDVLNAHFALKQHELLRTCRAWLADAIDADNNAGKQAASRSGWSGSGFPGVRSTGKTLAIVVSDIEHAVRKIHVGSPADCSDTSRTKKRRIDDGSAAVVQGGTGSCTDAIDLT